MGSNAAVVAQPQTVEIAQASGERVDLDHTVSPKLQMLEPFPLARHVGIVETPQGSTQLLRRQLREGLIGESPPALQELHLSDGQTELAARRSMCDGIAVPLSLFTCVAAAAATLAAA
jgi:hypothetical protein